MTVRRIAKRAPPEMGPWSRRLVMAAKTAWLPAESRAHRDALSLASARVLAVERARGSEEAQGVFWALTALLVGKGRSRDWRAAVDAFPADADGVSAVARTVRAYEDAAADGHFESLTKASGLRLREVVPVLVRVSPDGPAYVDAVKRKWFRHPNRVFSEDAVSEVASRLRGSFGEFSEQSADHGRQIDERVRTFG